MVKKRTLNIYVRERTGCIRTTNQYAPQLKNKNKNSCFIAIIFFIFLVNEFWITVMQVFMNLYLFGLH